MDPASVVSESLATKVAPQRGDPDFMMSLARGLTVIRAFDSGEPSLSLADVARRTNLSRAATRRCLHTLQKLGYAANRHGRYVLTPTVLALGHAYFGSVALPRLSQPILDRLSAAAREACSVAVLDGDEVVRVACAGTRHIVSIGLVVGGRSPAYCTSMGRVLLAYAGEERLRAYRDRVRLVKHTPRSIDSWSALHAELVTIRERGFALVDQESEADVTALAVPIRRDQGAIAGAMSLVFHAPGPNRATLESKYLHLLRGCAAEVAAALDDQ